MRRFSTVFLLALFLLLAGKAWACDVSIAPQGLSRSTVIDPFSPRVSAIDTSIVLVNRSRENCSVQLRFESSQNGPLALRSATEELRYRLHNKNGRILTPGGLGMPVVARPGRTIVPLRAIIEGRGLPDAGNYEGFINSSIYSADGDFLDGPRSIRFAARVAPRAQVNVAGRRGPFSSRDGLERIDFGALTEGETERVFVQVRSNTDVSLSIRSENGGVMEHTTMPSAPGISYLMRFDGQVIGGGSRQFAIRKPSHGLSGQSYPVDITVGSIAGKYAGVYRDIVRISVTQN